MHLGVKELADRLNVPVKVIYNMRYHRKGPPAIRVGRELRFRLVDVERWENEQLERSS